MQETSAGALAGLADVPTRRAPSHKDVGHLLDRGDLKEWRRPWREGTACPEDGVEAEILESAAEAQCPCLLGPRPTEGPRPLCKPGQRNSQPVLRSFGPPSSAGMRSQRKAPSNDSSPSIGKGAAGPGESSELTEFIIGGGSEDTGGEGSILVRTGCLRRGTNTTL